MTNFDAFGGQPFPKLFSSDANEDGFVDHFERIGSSDTYTLTYGDSTRSNSILAYSDPQTLYPQKQTSLPGAMADNDYPFRSLSDLKTGEQTWLLADIVNGLEPENGNQFDGYADLVLIERVGPDRYKIAEYIDGLHLYATVVLEETPPGVKE